MAQDADYGLAVLPLSNVVCNTEKYKAAVIGSSCKVALMS